MTNHCLVIGHRGFKSKYPENTLGGFRRCYEAGASVFETDVFTTKDSVLVISHDVNTKRVFCDEDGNETDYVIPETDYAVLKPLRTIGSGEPLLTFKELLEWFVDYGKENGCHHRIMLDVKNANPPALLRLLVDDMKAVHSDLSWWFPRIQIGVWNLRFVQYLNQDDYFQRLFADAGERDGYAQFDLLHISVSWQDSLTYLAYNDYLDVLPKTRKKFKVTGVSIIYLSTWSTDFIEKFVPVLKAHNGKLFTWTINSVAQMDYFCALCKVSRIVEHGVITDSPDVMVENDHKFVAQQRSGESSEVKIPLCYRFFFLVYRVCISLSPAPTLGKVDFAAQVDPDQQVIRKPKLANKIFAYLQHMGIL